MKKILILAIAAFAALTLGAEETAPVATATVDTFGHWAPSIIGGLIIAVTGVAATISQGKAAIAAIEGTARNPEAGKRIFILLILALALIESIVIYALVVTFTLIGKV